MIKLEKKKITYEREEVTKKRCDMCGRDSQLIGGHGEWGVDKNHIASVVLRYEKGRMIDGEAKTKIFEFDICPPCFETKFINFIGSKPRVTDGH